MTRPFAIGVTGHRPHKLNPDGLDELGAALLRIFAAAGRQLSPRPMACVTSLAEGIDTMAAETALSLGWRLISPLPFPADEYAQDFAEGVPRDTFKRLLAQADVSVCTEGRAGLADEAEGYRAASHAMLRLSDAAIAVWNGAPTTLIGGAHDTLIEALRRGLPVLWIPASGEERPRALMPSHRAAIRDGISPADSGGEADFLAALNQL